MIADHLLYLSFYHACCGGALSKVQDAKGRKHLSGTSRKALVAG